MRHEVFQHDGDEHLVLLGRGRRGQDGGQVNGEHAEVAHVECLHVRADDLGLGERDQARDGVDVGDLGQLDGVHCGGRGGRRRGPAAARARLLYCVYQGFSAV